VEILGASERETMRVSGAKDANSLEAGGVAERA